MVFKSKRIEKGFTLVEVVIVIIIAGILAAVALRSVTKMSDVARVEETKQELQELEFAIVGNSALYNDNTRGDFGYTGDIGSMPPNLDALFSNPGGYATWNGPYVKRKFQQDVTGYKQDAWGANYAYTGGVDITSTGSGSNIVRKFGQANSDFLMNGVDGIVLDIDGTPPGAIYKDSVSVRLTFPNGGGSYNTKSTTTEVGGYFSIDSVPIGNHDISVIYLPNSDTLKRFVSVLPKSRHYGEYFLSQNVWFDTSSSGGGGGGCGSSGTIEIRPNSSGSVTNLTNSGCSANWQCVDETTADGDATRVERASNSFATDIYNLENPTANICPIQSVTVYCRARLTQTQGEIQPAVYVNGTQYLGTTQTLTSSYVDYSHQWNTNPNTSANWTWSEMTSLQAGLSMRGQNSNFPAYCTQVWVVIAY